MKLKSKKKMFIMLAIVMGLLIASGVTVLATSGLTGSSTAPSGQVAVTDDTEDEAADTDTVEDESDSEVDNDKNNPAYIGSISLGTMDATADSAETQESEAQEDASLASKATITAAQTQETVQAAFPSATVSTANIGDENGYLIYEVNVTQGDGTILEVKVDAGNGAILAQENSHEDNETTAEETSDGPDADDVEDEVEE